MQPSDIPLEELRVPPAHVWHRQWLLPAAGGLDINILSRSTPQEARREIGTLMEVSGARGRYAVGSGNSVPSCVPVENYLAMVEEAVTGRGLA